MTTLALGCFVAVFAIACGSDSHPPGVGDDLGTDASGSGGKGGASGKNGAGGGHAAVDGGTADSGIGGSGADAGLGGGATNGGSAGRDASSGGGPGAGGTGSGGRPATDGGPLGDANLGAGGDVPPPTPGTIGTGTVDCEGVAGNSCGSGTACCAKAYTISRECVTGYADCSCYAEGSCPLLGCDEPEDCPGAKCCATVTPDGDVGTTWCKKDCEAVEHEVCKVDADCSASDATCALFGSGIFTCN
ncbi:MAG TPA: hypothetical protein VH062_28935 [Polyangiaceae bacterium]|jgi:hypothetical protein|nr:hypothetical protein [Polyangiaceae bacterium]